MEFLRSDLRHACRRLLASPGFALLAITSIALGVGASTAVFGAVRAILFQALPYPQPERVVALTDRDSEGGRLPVTYGTYREIAERSRSFERLAVADRWQPALVATAGDPERLDGDRVSADYFRVLGVAPALGRDFAAADDVRGGPPVAIVSASLAARRLGGARAALGRPIVLDGADLHRHRRDAGGLQERARADGGGLGAAAISRRNRVPGARVGPPFADGRAG